MLKDSKKNLSKLERTKLIASAIIADEGGHVLILRRGDGHHAFVGMWQLPEGKMEMQENAREAMVREVMEETGTIVKDSLPFTAVQTLTVVDGVEYLMVRIVFLVACEGILQLSDEHTEASWVGEKELKEIETVDGTEQIISEFWRTKRDVHSFTHWTERDGKINYR